MIAYIVPVLFFLGLMVAPFALISLFCWLMEQNSRDEKKMSARRTLEMLLEMKSKGLYVPNDVLSVWERKAK